MAYLKQSQKYKIMTIKKPCTAGLLYHKTVTLDLV